MVDERFPNQTTDPPPRWADNGGVIVEPNAAKKDVGWVVDELPPNGFFNWYQELAGRYMKLHRDNLLAQMFKNYSRIVADDFVTEGLGYDAINRRWAFLTRSAGNNRAHFTVGSDANVGNDADPTFSDELQGKTFTTGFVGSRHINSTGVNWIACGAGGVIQTTPADLSGAWLNRTTPNANNLRHVGTKGAQTGIANAEAVAVGDSGDVIHSTDDGVTWALRTTALASNNSMVKWFPGPNLWIAIGDGAASTSIVTSPDGITWAARNNPQASISDLSLAIGSGRAMIAGGSGSSASVITSTDGVNWAATTGQPSIPGLFTLFSLGIHYWNGLWVASGAATLGTTNRIVFSVSGDDGVTWNLIPNNLSPAGEIAALTPGAGLFPLIAGGRMVIPGDNDGVFWITQAFGEQF